MPSIVVTINGIGRTVGISTDDLARLLAAMGYMNVTTSWSDDDGVMHYPTGNDQIQAWADGIIDDLQRIVQVHEESKREPIPQLKLTTT